MPEQQETEWATVGRVVALFGVHGELKVRLLTDNPNRFAALEAVYVESEHTRYIIQSARPYKGEMIILKLKGVDSASAAESLRDSDLQIPVAELATLPPDSYYQHDILGLRVFTLHDVLVGNIVDILPTGGNDVYVIQTPARGEVLIPAIKAVIKQIDLVRRTMHIDPMPGLLDNDEQAEENEAIFDEEGEDEING
ncbi:MAG TPA: ribosome maturation factor RimM [Ktedonobacteraceae bacterium]|nr:ribosome maturation factor RimM [Ktedonobacteraceae bacterium]